MGMDLNAIEQAAFEEGWEAALVAVRIWAVGKQIPDLEAALIGLAGSPPLLSEMDDAI